jgi:hypothetical protein
MLQIYTFALDYQNKIMRLKFYNVVYTALLLGLYLSSFAQTPVKMTREEYIMKYKLLAVRQMNASGIPASIIMAQACLESDNGNSRLALQANNHFGIKCHTTWKGEVIHHDDDKLQECFRKYEDPEGSFYDHSEFLRNRNRYAFLFDLSSTDYKAWAHGLKKAGYATNPLYAELLIKIIEENNLHQLDEGKISDPLSLPEKTVMASTAATPVIPTTVDIDHYIFELNRKQYTRNGVKYVLAREDETYRDIAIELGIKLKTLENYNDCKDHSLRYGEEVYIQTQKRRASRKLSPHISGSNETMHNISQRYAVRLKKLYEYNNMKKGEEPRPGSTIFLRKK